MGRGWGESAQAKLESGAARTGREAERQLAEELDRPEATIHHAIWREKQAHKRDFVLLAWPGPTVQVDEHIRLLDLRPWLGPAPRNQERVARRKQLGIRCEE